MSQWVVVLGLLLSGCYRAHGVEETDADLPDAPEIPDTSPDVRVPFDGGVDAPDAEIVLHWDGGDEREAPEPCRLEGGRAVHELTIESHWRSADVVMSPLVAPIDGASQVLVNNRGLWQINLETEVTRDFDLERRPDPARPEFATHLAAADLNNDRLVDVVVLREGGGVVAWGSDGYELWRSDDPTAAERAPGESGAPTIADLEGDGHPEVIVGRTVLDGRSGNLRWQATGNTGRGINDLAGPISCVADLDGDGIQEVIAGRSAFRANGRLYWNADTPDGFCAPGDVMGDAALEVVLVADGRLHVLDGRTGEVLWERELAGVSHRRRGGPPALTDVDGDGRMEIVATAEHALAMYDPDCSECEEGLLWTVDIIDESSCTSASIFDFEGDGSAEVVHNDHFHLRLISAETGEVLAMLRNHSRTRTEAPVIADVDGDDQAEIIVSSSSLMGVVEPRDPGVVIIGDVHGSWVGTHDIWPQHAYAGTELSPRYTIDQVDLSMGYRHNIDPNVDPTLAPNLWIRRAEVSCRANGWARVRVHVHNDGALAAPARIPVFASDGDRFWIEETDRVIPPGRSAVVEIELEADGREWTLMVDHHHEEVAPYRVLECAEDDNTYVLGAPRCSAD